MGAGHGHAHGTGLRHRRRLWAALAMLAVVMLAEAATALLAGSLALLSDAGHMFTDVLGIGLALAAITAARRAGREPAHHPSPEAGREPTHRPSPEAGREPTHHPSPEAGREPAHRPPGQRVEARAGGPGPRTPRKGQQRTFGLYRLEVLAALANAVLLSGVAFYVLVEAARRLIGPPEVQAGPMLAVAVAGLAANLVAFALLRAGARESLNVRGAYLEVLGDLFGSVGVIVAAAVIALTGWWYADPIVAVAVGLFILPRTWQLARAALRILVQAAPAHLDVTAVASRLAAVPGVIDVHDLHVWTLTSGMEVASAHLTLQPQAQVGPVLAAARASLRHEFRIEHATLQVEPAGAPGACREVGW